MAETTEYDKLRTQFANWSAKQQQDEYREACQNGDPKNEIVQRATTGVSDDEDWGRTGGERHKR